MQDQTVTHIAFESTRNHTKESHFIQLCNAQSLSLYISLRHGSK